ncbi:MAG: YegS/Rv2252/BmrU family lipid kinase [Anaerovibrio sp.]|uniref:diacylglycerol/lipid kinase family protein n=1 Tax=Anaerovibrio sp. TaxID=1872532 RepID=UPI00260B38E6|nr:YegS/Rv2252/BmrU family lipid kinase [Anaerovibrio sp.]MDD7677090.1 YegS/Rv2252/BmrU family lipid kinase [Anaerovibrio sp.]MDY2604173.1 YegS/Rv2252/BmrU family lipid kinase [Anaerovibrio sp.]
MKKIVLVYNPVSGKAKFKRSLDNIIGKLQRRGCMVIPYRTTPENKDLAEFIRQAEPEGIIAAGGDGTVHEVVNLVMHEGFDVPVGIIGSGTSNDFATYLRLDTKAYFDRIAQGKVMEVDLGKVGDEYFINVASAGMVTSIAHEVDTKLKNTFGKLAYYVQGLKTLPQFKALDITIRTEDEEIREKAFLFLIVNSSVVASFKNAARQASVQDGKLDLLLVKQCNIAELMTLTAELLAGKDVTGRKEVIYRQAASFQVSCDTQLVSDLDGELGPELPLKIETIPKALKLFY